MATNKHATIRYHTLDKCFGNYGRRYFIENLIDECNRAIFEFTGIEEGIKRRQVFADIAFMESEQGWSIPLERLKEGKRVYYRYSDRSFSLNNLGLNQVEAEQLRETLLILGRFKGMPNFEWIDEINVRLEEKFKLKEVKNKIVSYEENPYLKGLTHFSNIFNAIQNEVVLVIKYKGFKQGAPINVPFHPWFLKQYNNRWFVFGFNDNLNTITNLALDRIIKIEFVRSIYKKNDKFDFEEYFEDIIGVTVNLANPVERLIIKVNKDIWPYIESKPLHGSQKVITMNGNDIIIELQLRLNYELLSLLFSYMAALEIIEPKTLRERIKCISESIFKKYI